MASRPRGTLCSIYGGLGSCLTLIIFSPVVSGAPSSILKGVDFQWFPLTNPGIVSIPFSFLCGFLGTMSATSKGDLARQPEMEVRSLTGTGSNLVRSIPRQARGEEPVRVVPADPRTGRHRRARVPR